MHFWRFWLRGFAAYLPSVSKKIRKMQLYVLKTKKKSLSVTKGLLLFIVFNFFSRYSVLFFFVSLLTVFTPRRHHSFVSYLHSCCVPPRSQRCSCTSQWAPATPLRHCNASWEGCRCQPQSCWRRCRAPQPGWQKPPQTQCQGRWPGSGRLRDNVCSTLARPLGPHRHQRPGMPGGSPFGWGGQSHALLCSASSSSPPGRPVWSSHQRRWCRSWCSGPLGSHPQGLCLTPRRGGWRSLCRCPPPRGCCCSHAMWTEAPRKCAGRLGAPPIPSAASCSAAWAPSHYTPGTSGSVCTSHRLRWSPPTKGAQKRKQCLETKRVIACNIMKNWRERKVGSSIDNERSKAEKDKLPIW